MEQKVKQDNDQDIVPYSNKRRSAVTFASTSDRKKNESSEKSISTASTSILSDNKKHDKISNQFSQLNYPQGFKRRPFSYIEDSGNHLQDRFEAMPGSLQLDSITAGKYFGDNARDQVFMLITLYIIFYHNSFSIDTNG